MKQKLITLRMFIRHEPRGFVFRLAKNFFKYFFQKNILGKKFGIQKIHNYKMKLNLRDPGISRTLFLANDREREHTYLLEKITVTGDIVLDLGANIGYYALMEAGLVQDFGKVIAVEPHPSNYKLLKENIELNKVTTITPIHAAVTDHDGTTELYVSKLSNVHSVLPSVNYAAGHSLSVPSLSLSSLVNQFPEIKVIRMDIEGYETIILQSLIDINQHQSFKPSILFELHAKKYEGKTMIVLLEQLESIRYSIRYLATSNKNLIEKLGLSITTSISTDGKVRHILENVSIKDAEVLIPTARCLVLSAD